MYPDEFVTGKITHNHPSQPGKLHAVIQRKEVKDVAISNPFRSARVIFEEVANKILQEDQPIYSRENPENLIRAANRIREKTRPKDPRDLDFIVNEEAIPNDFLRADVTVKGERYLMFSTTRQLSLLAKSSQWFVDGTFKIVKKPFHQLVSIHSFVKSGSQVKMVPLCYILMSRRRKIDYIKVLRKLVGLMPEEPNVKCATMDFEAATWRAFEKVLPDVKVKGCLFHFTQAIWRRCQELGLQKKYRTHKGTSDFIRKLMSLPFLPKSHVLEVFQQLKSKTSCPDLLESTEYVQGQWLHHSIFKIGSWSIFNQTIRTNNHVEGWHRRMNNKAGEQKLGLYKLINFLFDEAQLLPLQSALIYEGKLRRYLMKNRSERHAEIFNAWKEYKEGNISVSMLLRVCTRVHGPVE